MYSLFESCAFPFLICENMYSISYFMGERSVLLTGAQMQLNMRFYFCMIYKSNSCDLSEMIFNGFTYDTFEGEHRLLSSNQDSS